MTIDWDGGGVEFLTDDAVLRQHIKDAAFGDPGSLAYLLAKDRLDAAIAEAEHLVAKITAQLETHEASGEPFNRGWWASASAVRSKVRALLVKLYAERKMHAKALAAQRAAVHEAQARANEEMRARLGYASAAEERAEALKAHRAELKRRQREMLDRGVQPGCQDADESDPLIRVAAVATLLGRGIGKCRNGWEWDWSTVLAVLDKMAGEGHPLEPALREAVDWAIAQLEGVTG